MSTATQQKGITMNGREHAASIIEAIGPLDSATRGRVQETLVFDHGSSPRRIGQYSDIALVQMIEGCEDGGWFGWVARNREAIEDVGGPGVNGGPAEERIATDAERAELKAAFWKETRLQTLWFHGSGKCSGFYSVDEALALVRA